MERYICVHGHFYQPPRENPWLEAVELQDSAYPYHDWNERIAAECYAPNAAARVLDGEGRIVQIVNNYARMSFNVGPTLLKWLEDEYPDTYAAILRSDRESRDRFSGHGSALAQAYNHMILPLADRRDKVTQTLWGIRDFERRFERAPEGMWLPETAVDLETLEVLAELGILFTVLAPHQASRARRMGARNWRDVSGGQIDPSRAYAVRLPSGRSMSVFFYDGPVSRAVAFESLLETGEGFAERLMEGFSEARDWPQLSHIATDGESYGHHHRHGDMALASALDHIEHNDMAKLTNYGEFLERFPPAHEAEIVERTSWSCAHGVERWRSDCGCNSGGRSGWNQGWRAPLREALDWLRDESRPVYEEHARGLLNDPWEARDDYVSLVLDRTPESIDRFWMRHAGRRLDGEERVRALKLLELQRHAMLMYTSCGWFFDELTGIETVQVIQYAGRAIQLAQELSGRDVEGPFLERLERAKSNIPDHGDGRTAYEKFVKPAMVYLADVCAHYAVASLFDSYEERASVYCYDVERQAYEALESGRTRLGVGQARLTSTITGESTELAFGALSFGDHNVKAGVREFHGEESYRAMADDIAASFEQADLPEVLRSLDEHFGASTYSLRSLFRDQQRRVLDEILALTVTDAEMAYRQLYEHHAPLMRFLRDLGVPLPKAFQSASEFVLNGELRRLFADDDLDVARARELLAEVSQQGLELDADALALTLSSTIERLAARLRGKRWRLRAMSRFEAAVDLAHSLPFEVDLWRTQNIYYDMLHDAYPAVRERAEAGDETGRRLAAHFVALGEKLKVRVE